MKPRVQLRSASQLVGSVALIATVMFSTPALAGFVVEARANEPKPVSLKLQPVAEAELQVPQTAQATPTPEPAEPLGMAKPKAAAPLPEPKPAPAPAKGSTTKRGAGSTRKTSSSSGSSSSSGGSSGGDELAQAQSILRSMISRYPILAGSSVSFGDTPGSYQAVCYYKSGRILVSPTHTASLSRIITHEAWHIIDWRDNGQIDWGESVPR